MLQRQLCVPRLRSSTSPPLSKPESWQAARQSAHAARVAAAGSVAEGSLPSTTHVRAAAPPPPFPPLAPTLLSCIGGSHLPPQKGRPFSHSLAAPVLQLKNLRLPHPSRA